MSITNRFTGQARELDIKKAWGGFMNLEDFDTATSHPYECECNLCKQWWEEVGPEREGEDDFEHIGNDDIAF